MDFSIYLLTPRVCPNDICVCATTDLVCDTNTSGALGPTYADIMQSQTIDIKTTDTHTAVYCASRNTIALYNILPDR